MYDFNVFEQARKTYLHAKCPFLDKQRTHAQQTKPYQGLKILHNTPLTLLTAFKIEVLALGGAEVITTCISILPPERRAVTILEQAHFKVQITHQFNETFDFHLDCCGELLKLPPPKIGCVELTQTGSQLYKNKPLNYPVISVDDSKLKVLETFLGTGDGFFRALYQLTGKEIHEKSFVIFGNGKVARGIIHALKPYASLITVIDINPPKDFSYNSKIQYVNATEQSRIKEVIANAYCAITATGIKNVITEYYSLNKADFGSCILTNMGADDEYGDNFSVHDVVFHKKPFNFSLDEPTAFRYLDPILYAHNLGIDLILSKQIPSGYNPFPDDYAQTILDDWQSIYNESIDDAFT